MQSNPSAANVARGLTAKVDFLIARLKTMPVPDPEGVDNLVLPGSSSAMFPNTLAGAMGLTYDVDPFYGFEPLLL